jgi:hypothetical protein
MRMRRLLAMAVLLGTTLACVVAVASELPATATGVLDETQAAEDARLLQHALRTLHPALTKYRSQAEIDAAFAHFDARARAARTSSEMYLAASELAAAIRCGHTWTNVLNQQGAIKHTLLDAADKLPLRLDLVAGRWLVLSSADPAVSPGDEILAINGVPGEQVVARMRPYLRADGSSEGKRLRQLSHDRGDFSQMDIIWPLLSPPVEGRYALVVRGAQGAQRRVLVKAMTLAQRDEVLARQGFKPASEDWSFRIDGKVGILTLPTFAFHRSKFDWKTFLDDAFARLEAEGVPVLVIDVRANEGGDGAIGGELLTHLVRKPFAFEGSQTTSAFERVPDDLRKYVDTWDESFYDLTGKVVPITEGTAAGKFRYTGGKGRRQVVEPVARPYAGRVFLLVGPENSSAAFQLATLAQSSGAATLVGQRTGGNRRGLNGGHLLWINLPNSGVGVDIPLLAGAYTATTPDASVTPDVVVEPSFEAARAGRDVEMEAVRRLIR